MTARPKVLILGGGFAGLETAFTLRHRYAVPADITVVSDRDTFLYQPGLVYLPFGGAESRLYVPVRKPLFRRDVTFLEGRVATVDPALHRVELFDGTFLPFDFLVIATGATTAADEIPGLGDHAHTIETPQRLRELGAAIRGLVSDAELGRRRRVLFLVPPGSTEPGPLYETAFLMEALLTRQRIRDQVEIRWVTHERQYLTGLGLHEFVAHEFVRREIDATTNAAVAKVIDHAVEFEDGGSQEYDLLVSYPPAVPAVDYPALPSNDRGFVRAEPVTRRVLYHPEIYAPGDAGDTPARQALPALAQASLVAGDLANRIRPHRPDVIRSLALTSMRLSPFWTAGTRALGAYLSLRFRAGRPFWPGLRPHYRSTR